MYEFSKTVLNAGFPAFAETFWRVSDKDRRMVPFILQPPQLVIWAHVKAQMDAGKPVRIRILKARQQGVSLFWELFLLWWTLGHPSHVSLSIANKLKLPQQWIRQLRRLHRQLKKQANDAPNLQAVNTAELLFDDDLEGSRYMIESCLATNPGMGETVNVIHCSEIASWPDPDAILNDLLPAMPPTADTIIVQESTGRSVGDWWYSRYYECTEPGCEYRRVFLPFFLSPEYNDDILEDRDDDDPDKENRYTWDDLGALSQEEAAVLAYAKRYQLSIAHVYKMPDVTPGQMAWRRRKIIGDFHGDVPAFQNQYPACETEAFLSEGRNVFTQAQVRLARNTQRVPIARYDLDLVSHWHPRNMKLQRNDESGELLVYEDRDPNYHYVIGADCQWGVTDRSDFDSLHVECLETDRVVARCKGRYDLAIWGKVIAGLGWYYNTACVAPERNAKAANSVMPLLLGKSADWRYPNIYIRTDKLGVRISGPKGYGWYTDEHTKGELFSYAKTQTLATDTNATTGEEESRFDWCDEECVDQMRAYIWDDMGKMTAPVGAHDDLLMSRVITALVAHYVKPTVDLYIPKDKAELVACTTHVEDRMRWMADRGYEDYDELDYDE